MQFGGASVEPKTGRSWPSTAARTPLKHFTNNADDTGAQVGSTFKPFVLAAAMTVRRPRPARLRRTSRTQPAHHRLAGQRLQRRQQADLRTTTASRLEGQERQGVAPDRTTVTTTTARSPCAPRMEQSVNSPYVQLGMDVGTDKVREAAVDCRPAATTSWPRLHRPTFSLGTSSPSAIRMAGAYATFAASGQQTDPYSVDRGRGQDGRTDLQAQEAKPTARLRRASSRTTSPTC